MLSESTKLKIDRLADKSQAVAMYHLIKFDIALDVVEGLIEQPHKADFNKIYDDAFCNHLEHYRGEQCQLKAMIAEVEALQSDIARAGGRVPVVIFMLEAVEKLLSRIKRASFDISGLARANSFIKLHDAKKYQRIDISLKLSKLNKSYLAVQKAFQVEGVA